jgi:RNA polymerase sigma-70 factor (ECF subfamily)
MTTKDDHIYIDQILNGDANAFAILVDRYKNLVFTLTLRLLKNREEAEEASQDTFMKVYKSLPSFKGESKFSTYIYRVAYNTCLDRIKRNKKHLNDVPIDEFTADQVVTIDNALNALTESEYQKSIKDGIAMLPEMDGFLLTLYYFEDLSLDEMATVVNLEANTIKVRLYRSRKKLMTIFKERLEPEIIAYYEGQRR